MKAFTNITGVVAPIDRANVDTDAIIPKQYLKSVQRSGFGPNLFDEWRYLDHGEPGMDCSARPLNKDFVLNQSRFENSQILIARDNFGCGSSREHAVWALENYGISVVIAPSFADIFFNNCFKNGVLPIVLESSVVDGLFADVASTEGYALTVDLESQMITKPNGETIEFTVDQFRKHCLLNGLDDIALTLQHENDIKTFEDQRRQQSPWLFQE